MSLGDGRMGSWWKREWELADAPRHTHQLMVHSAIYSTPTIAPSTDLIADNFGTIEPVQRGYITHQYMSHRSSSASEAGRLESVL